MGKNKIFNLRRASMVGPAKLWEMKRDLQIEFLKKQNLKSHHYLLDIGCGVLRGGIPIIDYLKPKHYYGIEVSPDRLEEGKLELKEHGLEDKYPVLSTNNSIVDRTFDFVWSYQVFIHMSDSILDKTLNMIHSSLKPEGICYATINLCDYPKEGKGWQEFPHVGRPLNFYESIATDNKLNLQLIEDYQYGGIHNRWRWMNSMVKISKIMDQEVGK
tara:strand:+ start:2962 stop:3606 length:645 start_codon:yes stop_codon:yes gene_type:complete